MTTGELVAWLPIAATVIEIDGDRALISRRVAGDVEPVDSLAGDPWGRAAIERTDDLGDATAALAVGDVAAAAYMVGEAEHLLHGRRRLRRRPDPVPNADRQLPGVAHPLADCHLRLAAARTLTRIAAHAIDTERSATARRDGGDGAPLGDQGGARDGVPGRIRPTVRWGSRSRARSATARPRSARRASPGTAPGAGTEHIACGSVGPTLTQ